MWASQEPVCLLNERGRRAALRDRLSESSMMDKGSSNNSQSHSHGEVIRALYEGPHRELSLEALSSL